MLKIRALLVNSFSSLSTVAFPATSTIYAGLPEVPALGVDDLPHVKNRQQDTFADGASLRHIHSEERVLAVLNTRPSHAAKRLTGDEK